jgi:hypothetical protein
MKIYKIVFVNNQPIDCKEITDGIVQDGKYHYVHSNGKLIYAIVKANSEADALRMTNEMAAELKENCDSCL